MGEVFLLGKLADPPVECLPTLRVPYPARLGLLKLLLHLRRDDRNLSTPRFGDIAQVILVVAVVVTAEQRPSQGHGDPQSQQQGSKG